MASASDVACDQEPAAPEGPAPAVAPGRVAASLLYASLGDPRQGFPGYLARTPPDWTGERIQGWPSRHQELCAPFREGQLRAQNFGGERGRALVAGVSAARGEAVCPPQPPLALYQYESSRQGCEVCAHCGTFVGTLLSAWARPLAVGSPQCPEAGLQELVDRPTDLDEISGGDWVLRSRLPCEDGCGAVFCSQECMSAARRQSWHRVLCTDLPPEKRRLWALFQQHAKKHQEFFVLAAKVIAEIVCLVRHFGADTWDAMSFFTRFAKMSWLDMLQLPSRSYTQGVPKKGPLAEMARAKRKRRQELATHAVELLVAMLWERRFAELLTVDFFANLVGQFSLSNCWVEVEHPLAARVKAKVSADPEFRRRFGRLAGASAAAARALAEASDDEDAAKGAEGSSKTELDIWGLPLFQGSGLYVCCALSDHSCIPNFTMRYGDDMRATMLALREIREGDELNLAYVSPAYDLEERLTSLWRHWGFVCTCRKCQDQMMVLAMARRAEAGKDGAGESIGPPLLSLAGVVAAETAAAAEGRTFAAPPSFLPRARGLQSDSSAASGTTARGHSPKPGLRPSAAFPPAKELAAAAAAARAIAAAHRETEEDEDPEGSEDSSDEEDDDEEVEEEEPDQEDSEESEACSEEGASVHRRSDSEEEGAAAAIPYTLRFAPGNVPSSVQQLEVDLQRLTASLADDSGT